MATFFLYKQDKQEQIRKENPTLKISEITCKISEDWKQESAETKAGYLTTYEKNKGKYDIDMKEYVEKYGKPEKRKKKKSKEEKAEKKAKRNAKLALKEGKTSIPK